MLLEHIQAYLAALNPTVGYISKGIMLPSPDVCVALYEYGGSPPHLGFGVPGIQYETPGLQVRTRGVAHEYVEPRTRIFRILEAIAQLQAVTLSGTLYLIARPQQMPFVIERDSQARVVWEVNFLVDKKP